jgi:hypothetical protein
MNSLPEVIRLTGFELHRFIADGADGKARVRNIRHSIFPLLRIIRLHKRPTPRVGSGGGVCKRYAESSIIVVKFVQ